MTLMELYTLLQPFSTILGTIVIVFAVSGGALLMLVWFVRKTWKIFAAVGLIAFVALMVQLTMGGA